MLCVKRIVSTVRHTSGLLFFVVFIEGQPNGALPPPRVELENFIPLAVLKKSYKIIDNKNNPF